MATLFHVSPQLLNPGDHIPPGNWGTKCRQFGRPGAPDIRQDSNATNLMWEIALETARLGFTPESPSRADCVFTIETLADATIFRDKFRPGGHIYTVQCSDSTARHVGNYDAISNTPPGVSWFDYMTAHAISYWLDQPTGITEILVAGPATVVAKVG